MHRAAFALCVLFTFACPVFSQSAKVGVKEDKHSVDFLLGGRLATRYLTQPDLSKPVFWPVLAGETPVTRAWPLDKNVKGESTDHIHQKSFYFCHGDVVPEGQTLTEKIKGVEGVDFWSERPGNGVIQVVKRAPAKVQEDRVVLETENLWTQGKLVVLREKRTLTFRPAPAGWIMLVDTEMTASDSPVLFADTKEGSLGLRVNDQMRADKMGNGQIRLPGGKKGEKDCWGQRASWCDYAGTVNGNKVGLTVFASPKNSSPTCWHVRGYGLLAANPFGRKSFPGSKDSGDLIHLKRGETLALRYAVHVYSGERDEAAIGMLEKKIWE